ncbi:Unknown protein [Striga hermonthica]|uniref:Uncharacterized protein n=1 Tax=Striga hermonthica TaxID=68872 RepID=A0A9N7R2X9_STRHE|nr:Unknown protein [Striga hermonthica]
MKEKKNPNNKEKGRSARPDTRDRRPQEKNSGRNPKARQNNTKPPHEKVISNTLVSEKKAAVDPPQVHKNAIIDCVDDDTRIPEVVDEKQGNEKSNETSSDMEIADESDAETANDSFSSLGDSQTGDDERPEKADPAVMLENKDPSDGDTHAPRSKTENKSSNVQDKSSKDLPKEGTKAEITGISQLAPKISIDNLKNVKVYPKPISDLSEDANGRVIDEAPNGINCVCGNEDAVNTLETGTSASDQKIEEMEIRIKNLESELREVAALEISLYSVVPEHGSSAHKVHTPARRLSRLYIYACKYWSPDKRATVARNTVSGLVTVSKSCGNDVSRLTFWLSNTVVLREIISQAFGRSCQSSALTKIFESGGGETRNKNFHLCLGESRIMDIFTDSRVHMVADSGAQYAITYCHAQDEKNSLNDVDDDQRISEVPKSFPLLNSLSDLLMLPKDMLMERKIRLEVCPLISLPLVKRILCNFSPDEFCPDPVPGAVLEAVNAECIMEHRLSGDSPISFPFPAAPVVYTAPFPSDISEKVAEADDNPRLSRNQSAVQRKGYTSDDELDELESCLGSVINKPPQSPIAAVSEGREAKTGWANARYDLLREVWQTI